MASTGMWSISEYNLVVDNPAQLPGVVDIAIRTALARRGVAHLSFPNDLQVADANEDPYQHVAPARPPATAPIRAGTSPISAPTSSGWAARTSRTCRSTLAWRAERGGFPRSLRESRPGSSRARHRTLAEAPC